MQEPLNLTVKQQKFVDCFAGNIKEAAEKAGLTYQYCRRLATKSNIMELIKKRQETEIKPCDIATRQQRQRFWSETMNDTGKPLPDRLRASELLGKSEADFTVNMNHKLPEGSYGVLVVPPRMDKEQWQQFAEHQQS